VVDPPCSVASFEVNSEPHTGARPSARLYVGLMRYIGFGVLCPPEHSWLGRVPFCIKPIAFCFTLVCCVLCELFESVLALECCKSLGVAGVMTSAVDSKVSKSYLFSFIFAVSSMGYSL
jgi:hypothetical protein